MGRRGRIILSCNRDINLRIQFNRIWREVGRPGSNGPFIPSHHTNPPGDVLIAAWMKKLAGSGNLASVSVERLPPRNNAKELD